MSQNTQESRISDYQSSIYASNFVEEVKLKDNVKDSDHIINAQDQISQEQDKKRQRILMQQIHNDFDVDKNFYTSKSRSPLINFRDEGDRITSSSNDDRVTQAIIIMAEAKNWKAIKVSGHLDFKRKIWIEANRHGIDVYGYKPTEQDMEQLNEKLGKTQQNTIERISYSVNQNDQNVREEFTIAPPTNSFQQQNLKNNNFNGVDLTSPTQNTDQMAQRIYTGRVLDHGPDHYNHDKEKKLNYYVKLATNKGEKTVWGIDLKRSMSEEEAKTGDHVTLKFMGSENVKIETAVKDKTGKVIGSDWIDTQRNTRDVLKSDKAKVVEAIASTLIDSNVKSPQHREALKEAVGTRLLERERADQIPNVLVYDKNAPSQKSTRKHPKPRIKPTLERTR